MNTSDKLVLIISLLFSCSIGMIAQTGYYYKGKKIPLTIQENKVCMSIPKGYKGVSERVIENVNVQQIISDETFDIFVITRSDFEKLSSLNLWKEDAKSIILTPAYRIENDTEVLITPYLNVCLKKEQDIDLLTSYAEKFGLRIVKQDSFLPLWYILSITSKTGKNSIDVANALWESGMFAASTPDICSDDLTCSNDPMFNLQWGLYNSNYTDIDVSTCPAWNYATGKDVKIAILDKGVDINHIDLASNISDLSFDTETGTSPSVFYGDHGTHCAGIAAAVKDNAIQIAGVAPDATIVPISNTLGGTTNSRLKRADGIIWAYQHGVDIISNSWVSTYFEAIDQAIQNAFRYGRNGKGCIVVFSSGNNNSNFVNFPANCNDTILAVGAITNDGSRAPFSQYGAKLDLVAPGVNILSTLPNNTLGYESGTSMACPHVAGVAALILERNSELTVSQVNSIINSTAKKIPGINFDTLRPDGMWNEQYGYGLVDAYNAVISTPTAAYVQDEIVIGERTISADSIFVGKNVTDDKPYGNVTLGQGNIRMKANFVKIKNSTTVPLGTKLRIGK